MVVENKADLPVRGRENSISARTGEDCLDRLPRVRTSALTGQGIAELRAAILGHITGGKAGMVESGLLTSARHQGLVASALGFLEEARSAVKSQVPHEMILLDLYNALSALDQLTGATASDDILNLIFSRFCIGK